MYAAIRAYAITCLLAAVIGLTGTTHASPTIKIAIAQNNPSTGDAPIIERISPADGADNIAPNTAFTVEFDRPVAPGDGDIIITSNGIEVERIAVTSPQVQIDGETVTIDPATLLAYGANYTVTIDEGAIMSAPISTWNIIPDFALLNSDTSGESTCLANAPWGAGAWGIEAGSFQDSSGRATDRRLDAFRFTTDQNVGYLYARDAQSRWGLARYVQGTAWGGSLCGSPITWNWPAPMDVTSGDAPITLNVQHSIDTRTLLTDDNSWLMFAVNMWFNSEDAPKRLVVDIVLSQECNLSPDCGIRNFESDDAFHYMTRVIPQENASEENVTATVDVRQLIQDARNATYLDETNRPASGPTFNAQTLTLQQLEYVIEVYNAEGAAAVSYLGVEVP